MRHVYTDDHPAAKGRSPQAGEQAWTFKFKVADGSELHLHMGREARDAFRGFIFQEEIDDAVDEATSTL